MREAPALAVVLLLTAVSLPAVVRLRFDVRPASALPGASSVARAFTEVGERMADRDLVTLIVHGAPIEVLQSAGAALAVALRSAPEIGAVLGRADRADAEKFLDNIFALWPRADEAALERALGDEAIVARARELRTRAELPGGGELVRAVAFDPLGLAPQLHAALARRFSLRGGADPSGFIQAGEPPVVLVLARPMARVADTQAAAALRMALEDARREVERDHPGVRVLMTGPHVYAEEYQRRLQGGLWLSGAVSLALIVALCLGLFRDVRAMALIGGALALASVWTLAAAQLLFGELQILAVSAASILPAIGVDAGVHLYSELRRSSGGFSARLATALLATRRSMLVAGAASALGFLSFVAADVPVFAQFGALLAIGVVANLVAMFLALPALLALAERARLYRLPPPLRVGLLERLARRWAALPRLAGVVVFGLAVAGLAAWYRPIARDLSFRALIDPSFAGAMGQARLERAFGAAERRLFLLSYGPDGDAAMTRERALLDRVAAELPGFAVEAASPFWIGESERALARERASRLSPGRAAARLGSQLEREGFERSFFGAGLERLARLGAPAPLPQAVAFLQAQALSVKKGRAAVIAIVTVPSEADVAQSAAALAELIARTSPDDHALTGAALVDGELGGLLGSDARRLVVLAVLGVICALLLARMSARRAVVVMSALAWIFGLTWLALGALGVSLTLVTVLVFPFVLGIGIDASVYLCEHEAFDRESGELLAGEIRPLLGSTLTTLAGFVALQVVPFAPIRALGAAVSAGLSVSLLVALCWVPSLAPWARQSALRSAKMTGRRTG